MKLLLQLKKRSCGNGLKCREDTQRGSNTAQIAAVLISSAMDGPHFLRTLVQKLLEQNLSMEYIFRLNFVTVNKHL